MPTTGVDGARDHVTADSTSGLARLFEQQHDTLNRYFLKRTAHTWDAQDLVQELYLRILRTDRTGTDDIQNPEAYLFTIASNLVKEHATRKRCRAVPVVHYRDELGYREISERMQISTHMLKKYIVKALAACRLGMARYD